METLEGYGELTNLIKVTPVLMIEHKEGKGTPESVMRIVRTFVTKEGQFLERVDPVDVHKRGEAIQSP